MPTPHIRSARLDDEEELGLLDRAVWSPLHAVMPEPQPPYPPFFSERHPPEDCLVAEAGDRLAGYVHLGFPTPVEANRHVRQIQGLAVGEHTRGRGVGRALVRAAVDEARRRGARRLTLRVLAHNVAARGLYESEGFAVEGILPEEFLLDGKYVDDVLMGHAL
ncbi:N-acetyltransferase family protein [Streptomyces sp. CA-179760]|uniref:GNAT family N-acetyltransferase n=1 Tax=Streptomyces sp. CA-179760 TaxID=3240054 RepID=UPI003D8B16CF